MADFCRQCSVDIFGEDFGDLEDLCSEGFVVDVICEGCGVTQVNHLGECVSDYCDKEHGISKNGA